jgi:hypothetical protein
VTAASYIAYQTKYNNVQVSVKHSGLVVYEEDNCLAASPDAIVEDHTNNERGIAEWKNMSTNRNKKIFDILEEKEISKQYGNFCLRREKKGESKMTLHKKHAYYYQVQGLLAITEAAWCDFVVKTDIDLFVQRVYPDCTFWQQVMMPKLTKFYYKALLPELASPRHQKGGIREPGQWVCAYLGSPN